MMSAVGKGIMNLVAPNNYEIIKIEDSPSPALSPVPSPQSSLASANAPPVSENASVSLDPRDPEGFLKRCSGFNKKTKKRCNSVIGKKSEQSCHSTFLATCRTHRDQQTFAGWCQYQHYDGERCGRLFRWTPPYFELCSIHQGHPDTPCYFFRLPLELRHEVFRYLLPDRAIGSSTAQLHNRHDDVYSWPQQGINYHHRHPNSYHRNIVGASHLGDEFGTVFPMPALDLFLVNRQFYNEVKDLLFSTVPFKIDVRKDGTFMCGRRLLEPRRADGSSHFLVDEADEAKQRFLRYFDWSAVKHYAVDILVENWANGTLYPANSTWDEEVELYDIRGASHPQDCTLSSDIPTDYISVVVSGVLAKSRNLCKLQVRLCLADFSWTHEQILSNTKLIVGPFESLRNVRQPQILGISMGKPNHNAMLTVQRPNWTAGSRAPICSVPPLPTHTPVLLPGMPDFDAYTSSWTRWVSAPNACALTVKPPIRTMFTSFKDFYSDLSAVVPEVTFIQGRHAFLHRARVAREQEDVEAFRHLRNELIQYWYAYLEQEERKKNAMNKRLSTMLESDVYPSHEWEESRRSSKTLSPQLPQSAAGNDKGGGKQLFGDNKPKQQTQSHVHPDSYPLTRPANDRISIDPIDVACFAHVNLSEDWYAPEAAGPGPATVNKKRQRRVDSGFSEMTVENERAEKVGKFENDGGVKEMEVMYIGKGKGKGKIGGDNAGVVAHEVICID
jgi:hypothetical protein